MKAREKNIQLRSDIFASYRSVIPGSIASKYSLSAVIVVDERRWPGPS